MIDESLMSDGSRRSDFLRARETILLSTLNIKCGLICDRKKDSSVFRFSVSFSFAAFSIAKRSRNSRKVTLQARKKIYWKEIKTYKRRQLKRTCIALL